MAGLGAPELLIILVIILFVFGSTKLPQLARSLGTAKREFEHGQTERRGSDASIEPPAGEARRHAGTPEHHHREAG